MIKKSGKELIRSLTSKILLNKKLPYLLITSALICYSLFSLPTPREYGFAELIIAVCLIGFVAINIKSNIRFIFNKERNWEKILIIVAMVLAVGLLIIGLINKHPLFDIARDLIPLLYLFLPVMIFSTIAKEPLLWRKGIAALLVFSAIAMTIRYWAYPETNFSMIGKEYLPFGKGMFVFEPCTIFSSTLLITFPLVGSTGLRKSIDIILRIAMFCAGMFMLTLPVAAIMRGQIILVLIAVTITAGYKIYTVDPKKRYYIITGVGLSLIVICLIFFHEIIYFAKILLLKFQHAGLNMKDEEAMRIIKQAVSSPAALIFGKGWGATFLNPATGDAEYTRFTHNVFTYFLLKGGLTGVALFGIYFVWIIKLLIKALKDVNLPIFFAILNTLIIHFMLEGGFKLLSMGLIISILYTFNMSKEKETTVG